MYAAIRPAVLTMALLAAACGGDSETAAPLADAQGQPIETAVTSETTEQTDSATATRNPCAALPAAEASALVGLELSVHDGDNENGCSYRTADDNVKLIVKIVDAAGFDAVATMKDSESISGLGERASWNDTFGSLLVVKGEKMLDVSYDESAELTTRATKEEKKQRVVAIAGKIVPSI